MLEAIVRSIGKPKTYRFFFYNCIQVQFYSFFFQILKGLN